MENEKLTGWQSIETAPKDGTRVLLWLGAPWSYAEVACWYEPWDGWSNDPLEENRTDEICGIGKRVPTHWQPLPTPPGTTRAPADLRSALEVLERAATTVHRKGAVTGPQWSQLSGALITARAALAPTKGDVS